MTTPTWRTWRTLSSSAQGMRPHSLRERQLAALATFVTGTNPDGTPRGS